MTQRQLREQAREVISEALKTGNHEPQAAQLAIQVLMMMPTSDEEYDSLTLSSADSNVNITAALGKRS